MDNASSANVNSSQESSEVNLDTLEQLQVSTPDNESDNPSIDANTEPVAPGDGKVVLTDDQGNVEHTLEIDDRFKHLPVDEGVLRTYQSKYDTLDAAHNKLVKDTDIYQQDSELLRAMAEDKGLLRAYVNQVNPDLLSGLDSGSSIKEQLKTEFGDEYTPTLSRDEAERTDPGGTDWKYYNRLDTLAKEMSGNSEHTFTIKEYLAKIEANNKIEDGKFEVAINQTKLELKMNDNEVKAVSDWGNNLKFKDLVRIHRLLRAFPTRNPDITKVPGNEALSTSARQSFITETMGIKAQ